MKKIFVISCLTLVFMMETSFAATNTNQPDHSAKSVTAPSNPSPSPASEDVKAKLHQQQMGDYEKLKDQQKDQREKLHEQYKQQMAKLVSDQKSQREKLRVDHKEQWQKLREQTASASHRSLSKT